MSFLDKAGVSRLWTHITAKLDDKVDREDGKGLSTNDYTNEEKSRLEEVYTRVSEGDIPTTGGGVQADWEQSDENAYDYIKNKPNEIDAIELATNMGLVSPVSAEDGAVYTDENGALYSL